jgi:single-strand DNA-binding protein
MFDTYVTVVGNVLTAPEWRRTSNTGSLVASFKVASTARRLDRENGRWIDGNSLRVRVACWRRLAEGVASSVTVGDPVVVVGRLYTRDWTDSAGVHRALYEMEAVAVGHDLSRGRARFARNKPTLATSAVEDEEADGRVRGEPSEPVPDGAAPARLGDLFDDDDPDFATAPVPSRSGTDELTQLRGGGFDPLADPGDDVLGPPDGDAGGPPDADPPDSARGSADNPGDGDPGGDPGDGGSRPSGDPVDDPLDDPAGDPAPSPVPGRARPRRGRSREAVPA